MSEINDSEALQDQFTTDRQDALKHLDHFINDEKDYYVIYQKASQSAKRELKFNQVKKLHDNKYAIAMHNEDFNDAIRYYNGEEIILEENEIFEVRIIDPDEYDFVVYTD
ncbi:MULTISPECIES: hypothetical protein [Paraliobacillus]|uniref:hypothetical protein n=1 Tax=Paraliobacillus TaxID=200903 RepID=UPI000DD47C45|nr:MULTISPECIES: hypothetical protein [Paraliobacillus]